MKSRALVKISERFASVKSSCALRREMPKVWAISSLLFPPTAMASATVSRKSLTSLSRIALARGFLPWPFFVPFGRPRRLFKGGDEGEAGGAAPSSAASRVRGGGGLEEGSGS
jgi:hypothetical protein